MSWNLFEKILNAFRPQNEHDQSSEPSQQWPESSTDQSWQEGTESSQSCQEGSNEQPEASQEPSPSYHETPCSPQQDDCKQPENNTDWQQE